MKRILFLALLAAGCADASADHGAAAPDGLPTDVAGLAVADLEGGPVLAWVDSTKRLHVRPSGAPAAVVADDVSSHSQAGPRLAATSDGGLVVAYVVERAVPGRRFPASDLEVARSDDGGRTWAEPVRPYADPGFPTGHTFHSLDAGPDGTVVVAWLDGTARDGFRVRQAAAADGIGAHGEDAHGGHGHTGPADEPGTRLVAARSGDGGRTFGAPETVADGTCQCCRTALEVAADGTVYAVWRHLFPGGVRDVALARLDPGADAWTEPARVHADGWEIDGCPHAGPAVTTDADGAVHVAWPTGAASMPGLWRASSTDRGRSWTEPTALTAPAWGQVRAASPNGRAVFAFEDPSDVTVGVLEVGTRDTVRVAGADVDLDGAGRIVWNDSGAVRLRDVASL